MPAKSKQQLKLIWAIRRKPGKKKNAPKKWKWVFGEEWGHLAKESHILNFHQFNEGIELDKMDIEDLILEFVEDYKISDIPSEIVIDNGTIVGGNSYYTIDTFGKSTGISFKILPFIRGEEKEKFEKDLDRLLRRIERFGFNVLCVDPFGSWDDDDNYLTYFVSMKRVV